MKHVKFIGVQANIGDLTLKFFGQSAKLADATYREAVLAGVGIIPADEFDALFTPDQAKRYSIPARRRNPDDVFARSYAKACERLADLRLSMAGTRESAEIKPEAPKTEPAKK